MSEQEKSERTECEKHSFGLNKDSFFNLKAIDVDKVRKEIQGMLIGEEKIECAFQTVRDQVVFTNKRIITIDIQGITGMKKIFYVLPYSRIQYFSVETPGFNEIHPETVLYLCFTDGSNATYNFRTQVDIGYITRMISASIL